MHLTGALFGFLFPLLIDFKLIHYFITRLLAFLSDDQVISIYGDLCLHMH
jgi:hypothetical protein